MQLRQLKRLLLACSLCLLVYGFGSVAAQSSAQDTAQAEFFEKQIRPIFATQCARCHNPKAQVAKLDLTTAEGFAKGGESGALINKDKPEESRLLKAIGYSETLKMPPTGKLKDEEIQALAAWVKAGAVWPGAVATVAKAAKPDSTRAFTEAEKAFWSFQPLARPALPKVKNNAWVKAPIDAFVLQQLEAKGLKPAVPADKLTLLRRATFDLTGLPPSEKEINEFLADNAKDAFATVVDRLLASPRYGEKWGRHWLDVARYADSTGNDEDHRYPHAWKYRDYVIESFNNDLPYDQFIREQIAGDMLPSKDGSEVNRRGIIATGFLALGPKAIAQQDKKKMLYDVFDEQVDVTTKAFLGLTVACARCHNHKFDPLLTKDYYALTGMFASTKSFSNAESHVSVPLEKPLVPKTEWDKYKAERDALQAKQSAAMTEISEIVDSVREPAARELVPRTADYMLAAHRVYAENANALDVAVRAKLNLDALQRWVKVLKPEDLTPQHLLEWRKATDEKRAAVAQQYQQQLQTRLAGWLKRMGEWRTGGKPLQTDSDGRTVRKPVFEAGEDRFFQAVYVSGTGPLGITAKDKKRFNETQNNHIAELEKEIESLKKAAPKELDMACAVEEGETLAQPVFIRGDYHSEGEEAPRSFPAILSKFDTQPAFKGSGRLQFAEWLTQPEHPLTARVLVNRLWQGHFGEGLVRTPDNFGKMGERASHPELLDFLAREFVQSGWSIKAMHRVMMLSNTYQMASENTAALSADQDNRLLSRFNRRRLAVEELRDGLLQIDGTIDLTMFGSLQSGRGTDGETSQGRLSINPDKQKRRTVYLPLRRANLSTLLNLFDFGDATTMSGKRQLTNVSTQALFWLNSEFLTDGSTTIAKGLLSDAQLTDEARIASLYLRVLNRTADSREVAAALQYVNAFKQKFAGEQADLKAWQSFCRVLMASNDFLYVD